VYFKKREITIKYKLKIPYNFLFIFIHQILRKYVKKILYFLNYYNKY
jgi:hypothetical protein